MSFLAIFKRVAPFILTFAAGLFIASFFVTIALPNLSGIRRASNRSKECRQVKRINYRLEEENRVLRERLADLESGVAAPEFHLDVPAPPPPPRAHNHRGTGFGTGK